MRLAIFAALPRVIAVVTASALALGSLLALGGCSTPPPRSKIEDQSRRVAPLPACVLPLPARRTTSTALRQLKGNQVFELVMPDFDQPKASLPREARACTGADVLSDPLFAAMTPARGWPFQASDDDVLLGSGGDRLKVAWLRVFRGDDGYAGGPLALVRANEKFAELYAVGPYRGSAEGTRLGTERVAGNILVTAEEEGCVGHKAKAVCASTMVIFLPSHGALTRVADVATERYAYGSEGERGTTGALEYHLTSAARFQDDGVHLTEQVQVNDDAGREVRKAEVERIFTLDGAGLMSSAQPSLWEKVAKPQLDAAPPPRSKPPKPAHPRSER